MSAIFAEVDETPIPLTICPRCGRQVGLDGHCECDAIFFDGHRKQK